LDVIFLAHYEKEVSYNFIPSIVFARRRMHMAAQSWRMFTHVYPGRDHVQILLFVAREDANIQELLSLHERVCMVTIEETGANTTLSEFLERSKCMPIKRFVEL
jgi:hypothetical protein